MNWWPGWDSIESTSGWSSFFFWASIVSLFFLGVSEVISHRYTLRTEFLVSEEQTETKKQHEADLARLHLETAKANEEAARLKWQLDQEVQKRAPRTLTDEQKDALRKELKGKISEIAFVVQNDIEAQAFFFQIAGALNDIGLTRTYLPEPPPADRWNTPAGIAMYSPAGSTNDALKDDPVFRALNRAKLFGGTADKPYLSLQLRGPHPPVIPGYNGYVLYIGQKSPF